MIFLDWLISLAPQGETPLIVRQKPKNPRSYHADGALKCTWPAFLPDAARIKPNQAWYGNTASFIIDRFESGQVSASAANCEYCIVMVLDDIGTKSATPPLEPTWIMETSPGNYQWGYAFSDQPSKADFAAAIVAIAEAGYTDRGACNPVRNFRLPGSVNLKPDKDNFAARLIEFHPTREFTLEGICAALNVTPAESDGAAYKPIRLTDTGSDDVFAWLADQGLVLSKPNPEGWAGIICPNAGEHTDGNPEGRYLPTSRAFCCLHSHCVDLDSAWFLKWVADQGGPAHQAGLRDDLIASTMSEALSHLKPTDFFSDDAQKVIEEVNTRELGRLDKAQWWDRFAYVIDDDSYFDMENRTELRRGAFNALYRHVSCTSIHNQRRVEASICFDENRQAMGSRILTGITYAPGESVLVARNGEVFGNRWRDGRPRVSGGGDVTPWLKHCENLIPDQDEREHVFNVMAYKVQHPEVKINHAVLHGGDQGCGKDSLWAPFLYAVCGPGLVNRGLLDNQSLESQFGYALEAEVIILNELREPEARERRALANKLKPIIAAPPETIPINRKGLHPYQMVNRALVLAFSNDSVPISLDSSDRRWFCLWSHAPRMNPDAAAQLWRWYKAGGFDAVASWLHARDVSAFNPGAAPAWSQWKEAMIENGMSMAESYLVNLIRNRSGEFQRGFVGGPFYAVCDRLLGSAPSGIKIPQAALLHALKEAGWTDLGRVASAEYPTKKHLFADPAILRQYNKSDLRRMLEEPAQGPSRMAVVK